MRLFIIGSVHTGKKVFTKCTINSPIDISDKDAKRLVKLGIATTEEIVGDEIVEDENDNDLVDDLTIIKGIGDKTEEELVEKGIDTFEKLAKCDFKELSELDTITEKEAKKFIGKAKKIVLEMED